MRILGLPLLHFLCHKFITEFTSFTRDDGEV